ncbi:TPA: hypothetical protein ACQ8S2_000448 [Klebsiella pneumoniae]
MSPIKKPISSHMQEITNYVLSPCAMAAKGLSQLIGTSLQSPVWLNPCHQTPLTIPPTVNVGQIIIFIPDDPLWLLFTLRKAASLLAYTKRPLPVVLLSRSPTPWLWKTLLHQVSDHRLLASGQAVSSDLPCRALADLLKGGLVGYPTLQQLSSVEALASGNPPSGLSKIELNAIFALLCGLSINSQAQIRNVSQKTLYRQISSGLNKIAKYHPHMASRFHGGLNKLVEGQGMSVLTACEREFIHAIHSRQIFPVFQPIVDDNLLVQGFEILSRWRKDNIVLKSD